jgi:hypothetical protein
MAEEPLARAKPAETHSQPREGSAQCEEGFGDKPVVPRTPEEQMAAFEDALKESDWGHQPC